MLQYYPVIAYNLNHDKKFVTDIFRRIVLVERLKDLSSIFSLYTIQDGQSARDVAQHFYRDERKDWVILVTNNIINPYKGWCMSYADLSAYVAAKYDDPDGIHHYVTDTGQWSTSGNPVTNFEYEASENEARRNIRILRTPYVNRFIDQYKTLARQ